MKVYYTVQYEGVVDVDHEDWDDVKEMYGHDIRAFALTSVSEEIREFDEDHITINHIEGAP